MENRKYWHNIERFLLEDAKDMITALLKISVLLVVIYIFLNFSVKRISMKEVLAEYNVVKDACNSANLDVAIKEEQFHLDKPMEIQFVCESSIKN